MKVLSIENMPIGVLLIGVVVSILTMYKKFASREDSLKRDYEFAEKFIAENKWETMNEYLLEIAYKGLTGKHLDASIIKFFLNQSDPSMKLFNYHRGAKYLQPIFDNQKVIKINLIDSLSNENKFKKAKYKQVFLYSIMAFLAFIPLLIFIKLVEYDIPSIVFLLVWFFSFGIIAIEASEKSIGLDAAKSISELELN